MQVATNRIIWEVFDENFEVGYLMFIERSRNEHEQRLIKTKLHL